MDRTWGLRKFGKQRAIVLGSAVIYAVYNTWRDRQTDGWTRPQGSRDTRQENHKELYELALEREKVDKKSRDKNERDFTNP